MPALAHLEVLLSRVAPRGQVVARLRTVQQLRAWRAQGPDADLLIADVELGDGLSLEALAEGELTVPVVFTTAFDHYVLPALAGNGVAYLRKPVREDELAAALAKVQRLERHFLGGLAEVARRLAAPPPAARLVGRRGLDWVSVPTQSLAWVQVRHGATWAMDRAGAEVLLDEPLSAVQALLDPQAFHRANRWTLVSLAAIQRVRAEGRGRLALVLEPPPPEPVVVPQEGAAAFRAWFGMRGGG